MKDLEDFVYQIEQLDNKDLSSQALDDVWLAELSDEELIALIHVLVDRIDDELDEDTIDYYPDLEDYD